MLLASGLALALWFWELSRGGGLRDGWSFGALLAGGLLAELTAVRLPGFGYLGAGPAFYLAAAVRLDPGRAGLLAALCLGARTLLRGPSKTPLAPWRELACDMLAATASLAALDLAGNPRLWWVGVPAVIPVLVAVQVYAVVALLAPLALAAGIPEEERPGWAYSRRHAAPTLLAAASAGGALGLVLREQPWTGLLLVPVAFGIARMGGTDAERADAVNQRWVASRLDRAQDLLVQTRENLDRTQEVLSHRSDAYRVLETFAEALATSESLAAVLEQVVGICRQVVPCQSVAVFLEQDGSLLPAAYLTPHRDRLAGYRLHDLREPALDQVWSRGGVRPCQGTLFQGEVGVAVGLQGVGALYAGGSAPFSERQVQLLTIVAHQASLAIQSAHRREGQRLALEKHARTSRALSDWLGRLDTMLQASHAVASTLNLEELLERLESWLPRLVPHDRLLILAGQHCRGQEVDPAALQALVETLAETRVSLLVDDLPSSRFAALEVGQHMMAVPLLGESALAGVLVLGTQGEPFTRDHQHLLTILGYQCGVILENARLHTLTVDTLRQLQESQAQLVQSSKLAAVGELAAGVAHELNTPLGTILLAIDSARLETTPEGLEGKLAAAERETERAQTIVDKLLYYSRDARAGRVRLDPARVVQDTLTLIGSQLRQDGVRVETDLRPTAPVLACQNELQQVLINLLLNARDAVAGRLDARIMLRTAANGQGVAIEVEDNGPGIPAEVQDRVLEPFFTTKPVGRGTGLGLSISHQILEAHGGDLTFTSRPGRTVFRATLPAEAGHE
ncbi:MAG: ATP-binding protein [Candidatus Eremiobacterota bacterium]